MQKFTIILLLLLLAGCRTIDSRGQYVDNTQIEYIENKNLTKDEVIKVIGTPTLAPDYSPNIWYYISRSMERRAWFTPKVTAQRIVKITFNDNMITGVDVLNESHSEDIKIIKEYTKSLGNEQNPLQHFVHNIGRFNKPLNYKKHRYTKQ
jgi:outer membrane protein assembly factor BamE (lipoprotein component of BamABCDE complex)